MIDNNLIQLAKQCPDVTIALKAGELFEAIQYCVQTTQNALEQQITDSKTEQYLTIDKVSEMLGVTKVTLWRWDKQNYLVTVEVGGKRRYKMSDVKKLLDKKRM